MKKVVNINFQGRIIPIEETAFEQVQHYIQSLRTYFQQEEGRDEIINDIEDRIAELFEREIKRGTPCITDQIASAVIVGMGSVQDFEKMDGEREPQPETNNNTVNDPKGTVVRNSNDKIIGGVCSGIANAIRIDPTVVRVLFALLSFGGGTGILIYLILWVVLPEKPLKITTQKRLFRNADQKVIAGICGGIASYFNIPVWIPRIIFLLPVIAGIFSSAFEHLFIVTGGFGGTLFLTYIILWIVLPVAKTATEKMQMRGEKIDVNSIKSAIQDEMQGVKDRLGDVGKQLQSGTEKMSKEASEAAGNLSHKFSNGTSSAGNRFLHVIGILFKVIFWIITGIVVFVLIMTFSSLTLASVVVSPLRDVIFSGKGQEWAFWGTILFFLLTPAIALIIWIIRKIAGFKSSKNYLGYVFGTIWTIGWISFFYLVSSILSDFSQKKESDTTISIPSTPDSVLYITTTQPPLKYSGYYSWINNEEKEESEFNITEDSLFYNNVKLTVARSADTNTTVMYRKISYGSTGKDAEAKAKSINHKIKVSKNLVDVDYFIGIARKDHFRAQQAEIILQLPVRKKIIFDKQLTNRLNRISLKKEKKWGDEEFGIIIVEEHSKYEPGVVYVMTENGLQKSEAEIEIPDENKEKEKKDTTKGNEIIYQKPERKYGMEGVGLPMSIFIF